MKEEETSGTWQSEIGEELKGTIEKNGTQTGLDFDGLTPAESSRNHVVLAHRIDP